MNSDFRVQLLIANRASKERMSYFLAAASAACIGFAVTQTAGHPLESHHLWPGLALFCWTLSFISGIGGPQFDIAEISGILAIKHEGDESAKKSQEDAVQAGKYRRSQLVAFLLGAALYVYWHVAQMVRLASQMA